MTESTHARIPAHLKRYIVDQYYARYTPEDQAVWRYILRQLKSFLSEHAHPSYLTGLEKTGISIERIPHIDEIDQHLVKFGWGAVPVSGFIPPAAFMEFQSLGILPIASDMRTIEHLLYTPAPDIVHEAAGHAPILADPEYAAYLRQYGEIARRSIISKEDMDQYEAIRILSDIKEDPRSSKEEIAKCERRLNEVNAAMSGLSEAALLSRMNWWTAEYGLIGPLEDPKIFGAGLLSSVGEARNCLSAAVRKIPLSVDCVNFAYDITEQQPQLFVARDFSHLGEVLEQLAVKLSYRRGGIYGLENAIRAATVNSVELNSGIQISGLLRSFQTAEADSPCYLQFEGPTQLSCQDIEIAGQGIVHHARGYSTPVGRVRGQARCLSEFSLSELSSLGLREGQRARLEFESGVIVEGQVRGWTYANSKLVLITWADCRVKRGEVVLFDPAWGVYDMAVGVQVTSVFGGPADRARFGATEDFAARRVPSRQLSPVERKRHGFFDELRSAREAKKTDAAAATGFRKLCQTWQAFFQDEWLLALELLELSYQLGLPDSEREALRTSLDPGRFQTPAVQQSVRDGVALADKSL